MDIHNSTPPALAGLVAMLDSVTPGEAAILIALATSAVGQAIALRRLAEASAEPELPAYIPHPLDVLIFAALDQEGAKQQAELLAALDADTYQSQGRDRAVSAGTLKRRLPELVACGVLAKTAGGYIIADSSAIAAADTAFPG